MQNFAFRGIVSDKEVEWLHYFYLVLENKLLYFHAIWHKSILYYK